jgi:hypothetical protein
VQGHLDEKQCCIFPANEGADAGIDDGMPVSENHKAAKESGFTADGARAHARVGDAALIAGYCGKSAVLDNALAEWDESYGDQTEQDHTTLVESIKRGKTRAHIEAINES